MKVQTILRGAQLDGLVAAQTSAYDFALFLSPFFSLFVDRSDT